MQRKTPALRDILDVLEAVAPTVMAEDWDNPGLQVGDTSQQVRKILVSLDPTLDALREAARRDAQTLLSHHPLIFKPLPRIQLNAHPGAVIEEAIRANIAIVAAHTNLDAARGGINDALASLLGLQEVESLEEEDSPGLGRIGSLPKPEAFHSVVKTVKERLKAEAVKIAGNPGATIRRVAVVGGAGGSMARLARQRGADLLITGEMRHHEALEAEALGLVLLDAGHFRTEKPALRAFAGALEASLQELGWDASVEIYQEECDPIRYG